MILNVRPGVGNNKLEKAYKSEGIYIFQKRNQELAKTLHAFGDSFIVGDQDDWLHLKDPNIKYKHRMHFEERLEYVKYSVSFVSILAKHYNYNLQQLVNNY